MSETVVCSFPSSVSIWISPVPNIRSRIVRLAWTSSTLSSGMSRDRRRRTPSRNTSRWFVTM
jgi:hypothetical protein